MTVRPAALRVIGLLLAGCIAAAFAPPEAAQARENFHIVHAPSKSVWQITARPVSDTYGVGEPIFFDLQVENLSSRPARIDLGGDGKINLRITTTEPNGLSRPVQLHPGGLHALGEHLVDANATYGERLILNEWNDFRETGDYDVEVAVVPFGTKAMDPPSAHLHVSIGPRNEAKLRAVAKTFADRAIEGRNARDRMDGAFALSFVADPIEVPEMARVLASGSDAGSLLTRALACLGGPAAEDALQKAAQNHPDPTGRIIAARDLRSLRNRTACVPTQVAD